MNRTELIAAVREHALANYEQGWDLVVETYEDDEIATVIGKARTIKGAINRMAIAIQPHNERRREIEALVDYDRPDEMAYDDNPVPETFMQDVVEAEAQAHRIAEAIATGIRSAEHHADRFPSWEMISTESGATFAENDVVLERQILDQHSYLARYLCGSWSLGTDMDVAIGTYRDQAFVTRLMELELKRREQKAEKERLDEFSRYPRNTATGVVCGNCTHYDGADHRVIMRHATAQDVRDCYAARYQEYQQAMDELEAERRVERHFEEGF